MNKEETISYLKNLSFILVSILFFIFPIFFLPMLTEPLVLPKQFLIIFFATILSLISLLKMILEKRLSFRANPLNLPIVSFGFIIFLSSILSFNRYDSLFQTIPLLFLFLLFFAIINAIEDKLSLDVALSSLFLGGALSAIITALAFFKIYPFPFQQTHFQFFNTFGSYLQQLLYLAPLLSFSFFYFVKEVKNIRKGFSFTLLSTGICSLVMLISSGIILFQFGNSLQKPLFLPYMHGFQIALSSISQDSQRFFSSLLFGSGYGTFATDFTRFKLTSFNFEKDLWDKTFSYSSSYLFELIATTGILGISAFIFLIVKSVKLFIEEKKELVYLGFMILFIIFFLPVSFTTFSLFFFLLSLYISYLFINKDKRIYEIILSLVAFKKGLISITETSFFEEKENPSTSSGQKQTETSALPIAIFIFSFIIFGAVSFYSIKYLIAEVKIAQSLSPDALNNGQKAYDLQKSAIDTFPYKSDYYKTFSQLNFALANSLATQTQKNQTPENQKTIVALIQQSIDNAKNATALSPITVSNWVNLGQIYRNLINVGANAEQFAVASISQAVNLEPSNPQLYVELGGIYYQLKYYDQAQNQFQVAVNLKKDLPNAYYNLGHALEQRGDLRGALSQYKIIKDLVIADKTSSEKIDSEINNLIERIKSGENPIVQTTENNEVKEEITAESSQGPLNISTPSAQLPAKKTPVEIPPPTSPTPTIINK